MPLNPWRLSFSGSYVTWVFGQGIAWIRCMNMNGNALPAELLFAPQTVESEAESCISFIFEETKM